MVVGAARDQTEAFGNKGSGKSLRISEDLALIIRKAWLQRLVQTDGLCRDDMHQRAALRAWKDDPVEVFGKLLLAHDEPAAGSAQGLVRGCGHKIHVWKRAGMQTDGYHS